MARMRAVYMQPNVETKSDWTVSGAATDLAAVQKGQGVVAAPSTTTYISSTTDAQGERFGFPTFVPEDGEYVSYVRAHIYATTQANHTIGFSAYYSSSSPVADSPVTVVPASSSAGWFHSPKLAPRGNASDSYRYITQADIDSLQVGFTLTESSAQAGTSKVYAVVLEVGLSTMEHLEVRDQQMLGPIEIFPARFVGASTGEDANGFKSWGFQWGDTSAEYASATSVRTQLLAMRRHGANTIRAHVPYGGSGTGSSGYMVDASTPNETRFAEFEQFLDIAEGLNMRVIVTGLNLYLPANRPTFLAALNEAARWASFGVFWGRLARACAGRPSVIVLDLINEIQLSPDPNSTTNTDYYSGLIGTKYYFARLSIKWNGRTIDTIIDDFYDIMEDAIRLWEPVKPIGTGGAFPGALSSHLANRVDIWLPHIYTTQPIQSGLDSLALYHATGQPVINEESGDVTGSVAPGENRQFFVTAQQNYLIGTNTNWNEGGIDGDTSGNFSNALLRAVNVIPFVEATPDAVGEPLERLTIDGLALHDTGFVLEQLTLDPPAKRYNRTALKDGSGLAEPPGRDDRTIQFKLRAIDMDADSLDRAFHFLQILRRKLEEADRLVAEGKPGLAATWVASGSVWPMTVYVTGGDVTAVPKEQAGDSVGYFQKSPVAEVTLTCKPFLYGDPVTMLLDSAAGPMGSAIFTDVVGDVPAEAELEVRDIQGQPRRHVEWGLQQRNFNATVLTLDSDAVTTTGYSGTGTTRTGAYDPGASGNSVVRATPTGSPIAVCGMSAQAHMGRFRVRGRFYGTGSLSSGTTIKVRLRWRVQGGQWTSGLWVPLPLYDAWCEPELASIVLPKVTSPSWDWELDCQGVAGSSETVDFDYLTLLPVDDGYGRSVTQGPTAAPSVLVAQDNFNSLTAAASLNGRAAPQGGTWATSVTGGSPADFVGSTPAGSVYKTGTSEGTNVRRALLPTNRAVVEVGALFWAQRWQDSGGLVSARRALAARFVDSSNYLFFGSGVGGPAGMCLIGVVAGVPTTYAVGLPMPPAGTWILLRLIVYPTGSTYWEYQTVSINPNTGVVSGTGLLGRGLVTIPDCATGGALETGTCGFEAFNTSADTNVTFVENFFVSASPEVELPVVPAGGRARFGSVTTAPAERELSPAGWSRAPYQGSRFYLPAAGDVGYWSRLAWRAARADLDTAVSSGLDDVSEVRVTYTPRYVDVPGV